MLCAEYVIYASDALEHIRNTKYLLPDIEKLNTVMRKEKIALLPVDNTEKPDAVTHHFGGFLRYLRAGNIKTVMYEIQYYTAEDVEANYRLQDADKCLFRVAKGESRVVQVKSFFTGGLSRRGYVYRDDDDGVSDYEDYLAYKHFMKERIDLRHPRAIRLYAFHEGRVLACYMDDDWLRRIGMLDARQFKDNYINAANFRAYGAGTIAFRFIDNLPGSPFGHGKYPTRPIEPEENDYI